LVVVLGFLAILTLMAVGMAISMRTERLASSSYLDMVRARLCCEAALADAMSLMDEIATTPEISATNRFMPNFMHYLDATQQEQILPSGHYPAGYFKQSVISSIDSYIGDSNADVFTNSLIDGLAENFKPYMPGRFYRAMYSAPGYYGTDLIQGKAQWIHTTKETADGVVTNGRFMYIILNTTAQVDLNYVDQSVQPSGFKIRSGHGLSLSGSHSQFMGELADDVRYETTRDISDSNPYIKGQGGAWEQIQAAPSYVIPFSYFPPMRRIEIGNGQIELGRRPAFLSQDHAEWSRDDISAAFDEWINDASWKNAEGAASAEDLYGLLLDYVDEDFVPQDPEGIGVEAIPMINEFMVASNMLSVEVWAPFFGNSDERFSGEFELSGSVDGMDFDAAASLPAAAEGNPPAPLRVDIPLSDNPSNAQFRVVFETKDQDGNVLDRVSRDSVELNESWQCNDPRFNHLPSQWKTAEETLGAINDEVAEYADNPDNGDYVKDGDYLMYCANRSLRCTGELGYLPVAPWRTIKLYEDSRTGRVDLDPALDFFTMFPTNVPMYGLICPNGQAPAWAVPQKMILWASDGARDFESYTHRTFFKEHNSLVRLPNISDLGNYLYTMPEDTDWPYHYFQSGFNDDTADVVEEYKPLQEANPEDYSEIRLEHAMRRVSALYHVRQSHYTVLLWAQTLGAGEDGSRHGYEIKSEAQAVALVWRDPYPVSNQDQSHRKFVRFMRWME